MVGIYYWCRYITVFLNWLGLVSEESEDINSIFLLIQGSLIGLVGIATDLRFRNK